MPRNRYKNKHVQKSAPIASTQSPDKQISRTAQHVLERIVNGGEEYLMENAEHILIDSADLADEPEFKDITLNNEKAAEVTERWLEKYETRLKAAEKISKDEFQQVYDDVRIKIIDELAGPAFRKLVKDRLLLLRNRLMASSDARKIELVLTLDAMLKIKQIPWGLCGLVIEIYNRTLEKTFKEMREQDEIFETMLQALKEEGIEVNDPSEIMQSPEKLDLLTKKFEKEKPELFERLKEQADVMIDEFEEALFHGKLPLKLFSDEELMLPFKRIEEELGQNIAELQPSDELTKRIGEMIMQTIREIMTPERMKRLRKDAETTAKAWAGQGLKWAGPLQLEIGWLEGDKYEENRFVSSAFWGQIRRMRNPQQPARKTKKKKS